MADARNTGGRVRTVAQIRDATDDYERIETVLYYMTTDRSIARAQACDLLLPLLQGSPALKRVLRARSTAAQARGPGSRNRNEGSLSGGSCKRRV
jgi:hypothetical protein